MLAWSQRAFVWVKRYVHPTLNTIASAMLH